ncbi:unnamed protein product [Linum tenue]|uniref:Uncharacterized protein n=1 Tax=Linum tenue TaxID=586396 RepID=A0AAV0K1J2_9ROSI|nr:unnamed protein product [Linum tenue]
MASSSYPDVLAWIQTLPPISQWKQNPMSITILSSTSSPSLKLSVWKNHHSPTTVFFSISTDLTLTISLWSSKPINTNSNDPLRLLGSESISFLLTNFIEDILSYGPYKCSSRSSSVKIPKLDSLPNFKAIFNLSFLTLTLLVCIYEAPPEIRSQSLATLKNQLIDPQMRKASRSLMRMMGSNLEEQWMRSINLAITNWIVELQAAAHRSFRTPSPLFSCSFSALGLWKVQLYCPVIAMDMESSSGSSADEKLLFSLKYQQLEGVMQFNYEVVEQEKWVDVTVYTDNIRQITVRCDIYRLVNETLMGERGVGSEEKHFPSRIAVHITPILQTNIISVSVSSSSANPTREIELEKGIETSFDPPNSLGLKLSAGETVSMSLKPWKFEGSVYAYSAVFSWFLHDNMDGREVVSSKPSALALINPRAWFKDRYRTAYRPFTRQGGVVFAGSEYGKSITWKVDKAAKGKTMEFEIKGWIWLTYWPNKYRTFYSETRRLEFRETVQLTIA